MVVSLLAGAGVVVFAALLYGYDLLTARFMADPDPARINIVRVFDLLSLVGIIGLYATAMAFGANTVILLYHVVSASMGVPPRPVMAAGVFGGFAAAPFVRAWIRINAGRRKVVHVERPFPPHAGASEPYFMAMQYYALMLNRTYKVFVTDKMLCGAKVLGLVASPPAPRTDQLDSDGWGATIAATLYERLDVTSPKFLRMNFANFQISWQDVESIKFSASPKWGMGNVPYSGRIFLRLKSGRSKELILVGQQNGPAICKWLNKVRIDSSLL
jgi:hypothetical protein